MHVVVIGNGVAGVTAALQVRRRRPGWRITVVSGESTHHWSRPALMYLFLGHMTYQDVKPFEDHVWRERRIELVRAWAVGVDLDARRVRLSRGEPLAYDRLVLATGSKPNRFGWPGQDLAGVQGLYGLPDLRLLLENVQQTRGAVIVGGGLIGVELAEMLRSRRIHVTMLVREPSYWANVLPREESELVGEVIREEGVELRLSTELASIEDDGTGRCGAVLTSAGERLECQLVGLTAGVAPNLDLAGELDLDLGRGVRVDASFRTSREHVYAVGDCAELVQPDGTSRVEQVWYTARRQGEVAGDVVAGYERSYDPGIWFNSAKFFDLEYQVYGRVNRDVPGQRDLLWIHPSRRKAARIVFTEAEGVIGFNLMGLRFRHATCERWIAEHAPPERVLERLEDAWFDPELFRRCEDDLRAAFRAQLEERREVRA